MPGVEVFFSFPTSPPSSVQACQVSFSTSWWHQLHSCSHLSVIHSFTSANQVQDWIIKTDLLILLFSRIVYNGKRERALFGYAEKQKDYGYIYWGSENLRNNLITFVERGLAKPKDARYLRMQKDFPGEKKLPTEGGIKKTRFRSYSVSSVGGAAKKAELWTQRQCVTVRRWQSCMGTIIIHQKTLRSQGWCLRLKLHTDTANQKL